MIICKSKEKIIRFRSSTCEMNESPCVLAGIYWTIANKTPQNVRYFHEVQKRAQIVQTWLVTFSRAKW